MNILSKAEYQKLFALACRFLADSIGCPAVYISNLTFPECNGESEQCGNDAQWKCWQRYFRERVDNERVCRVCGCTEDNACPGGCWWVEDDLCSECYRVTNVEQTNNVPSISRSSMAQSTIVHLELEKAVEQGNTIILSDTKGERLQ